MQAKAITRSKTVIFGAGVTILSALGVAVDVWQLLGPDEMSLVRQFFGPTLTTLIGLAIIILRVVTRGPLAPVVKETDQ